MIFLPKLSSVSLAYQLWQINTKLQESVLILLYISVFYTTQQAFIYTLSDKEVLFH